MSFRCLLCDHGRSRTVLSKTAYTLERCDACAFVQIDPMPEFDAAVDAYEEAGNYAHESRTIEEVVLQRDVRVVAGLAEKGFTGPMLDIGAGAGTLVRAGIEAGWEVEAVELARPSAAEIRRTLGVPVHEQPLERLGLPEGRFGVITFSHSLEHVPSPLSVLREARRLLQPGGAVHIAVPNWKAAKRVVAGAHTPWIFPEHLSYFTEATMRRTLLDAGLQWHDGGTKPFLGVDYRFVIAVLRRLRLERPLQSFLHLGDDPLESLMRDDLQVRCPEWRMKALLKVVHGFLAVWPETLWCWMGRGEELRVTAVAAP